MSMTVCLGLCACEDVMCPSAPRGMTLLRAGSFLSGGGYLLAHSLSGSGFLGCSEYVPISVGIHL